MLKGYPKQQTDSLFRLYSKKLNSGNVSIGIQYWKETKSYNEHCTLSVYVNGERLGLQVPTTVFGKNCEKRSKTLRKRMLKEIEKRISDR